MQTHSLLAVSKWVLNLVLGCPLIGLIEKLNDTHALAK